jgi:transmembrane sensor
MVLACWQIRSTQIDLPSADVANQTQTCFHATGPGEHGKVTLPDGSKVDLNTNSQIRCAFSNNFRNVEVFGEAHFTVNSADPRPFQVLGGESVTRDLSTSFDVLTKSHSTLITVTGGSVKVAAPIANEARAKFREAVADDIPWQTAREFHRLQQVEVIDSIGVLRQHLDLNEDQLAQLLAWTEGRIDLRGRPLKEAASEVLRYVPNYEFAYTDRKLREMKVNVSMKFTDLNDFLFVLHEEFGVESEMNTRDDGVIIVTLSRGKKTVVAR